MQKVDLTASLPTLLFLLLLLIYCVTSFFKKISSLAQKGERRLEQMTMKYNSGSILHSGPSHCNITFHA